MDKSPKISIITPCLNSANYLEETILSVLNQNYKNLEYIIIDGGSTDGTVDIIKKYEKHLAFWVSETDNGMYWAIQKGFNKSTGELMAWLNSDDKYHQGALKNVAQIFSEIEDIEWITGTPSLFNRDGSCVKVFPVTRWSKSRFWIGDYKWLQQEAVFWRRSLWERADSTLNLTFTLAADFELWCRFFQRANLYTVESIFSGFRLHGNQQSILNESDYNSEVNKIVKILRPQGSQFIRYGFLKCFWQIKKSLAKLNFQVTNFMASVIMLAIDKLHKYPPIIYFDFGSNKWKV